LGSSKRTINGIIRRALQSARASGPPPRIHALVDPARDPEINAELATAGLRSICLYGSELPPELVAVAPHLVPLAADGRFGRIFATHGRGRAWGVLIASHAPAETLAEHLAGLTRARLPGGREVLFRYYDPRVLRAYLPTCTAEELDRVFGPIEALLVEGDTGQQREYVRDEGRLVVRDPHWELWAD
jgi:uncharacterized protein DUF4123